VASSQCLRIRRLHQLAATDSIIERLHKAITIIPSYLSISRITTKYQRQYQNVSEKLFSAIHAVAIGIINIVTPT
jgi:hypothetical protein